MVSKVAPISGYNYSKTGNKKHDWSLIKYLNVLLHNKTQKQLLRCKVFFA